MIECCCIDVDYDSVYTTIEESIVIARKEHICGECKELIKSGSKYERFKGVLNGDNKIHTHKTCLPCVGIRRDFFSCGFYYENIYDDFYECYGFRPDEIPEDFDDE